MNLFRGILKQMSVAEVPDPKRRFNSSFHAAVELHDFSSLLVLPDSCKLAAASLGLMRARAAA